LFNNTCNSLFSVINDVILDWYCVVNILRVILSAVVNSKIPFLSVISAVVLFNNSAVLLVVLMVLLISNADVC